MILFTALMTAGKADLLHPPKIALLTLLTGTGAVSVGTRDNIAVMYVLVTLGSLGVGGVIIPSSIIAQICCPNELIATVTAITLSIRYIGGAIGYTAYYNVFYHHFVAYAEEHVALETIVFGGIVSGTNLEFITTLVTLVGTAQFDLLHQLVMTSPLILAADRQLAYDMIVKAGQESFAKAYRWPYWMSIAFGGSCFIMAFFLGDIKRFLTDSVAAPPEGTMVDEETGKTVPMTTRTEDVQAVKHGDSEGHM